MAFGSVAIDICIFQRSLKSLDAANKLAIVLLSITMVLVILHSVANLITRHGGFDRYEILSTGFAWHCLRF